MMILSPNPLRRLAAAFCLAGWLAASAAHAEPKDPARTPLVLGQINVSFYAVTGGVVQEVLERLGHPVELREGKHKEIFPMLRAGEIDLLAAAWLPHAHRHYWEQVGGEAVEVATLYEGARLFWAVPDYVPLAQVATIADLAKPDVAARMIRELQGIGAGAGSSVRSLKAIAAYGLDRAGYTYRFGTWRDRWQALEAAVAGGRWTVVSMGAPMFLNRAYRLRPLEDPKSILGGANRGVLVGHRSLLGKAPLRTLEVLGRLRLGLEAVSAMDHAMAVEGRTARQAAQEWMAAHPKIVAGWFGQD